MKPWVIRVKDVGFWMAADPLLCALGPQDIRREDQYMVCGLSFPIRIAATSEVRIQRGRGSVLFRGGMAALGIVLYYAMITRAPADVRLSLSIDGRAFDEGNGLADTSPDTSPCGKWWMPGAEEMAHWTLGL